MEDHSKSKHPILPPNYVTLLELQERWTKEQQQKHEQKEQQPPQLLPKQSQDRVRNLSQPIRTAPHLQCHGNPKLTEETGAFTDLTVSVVGRNEDNEDAEKDGKRKSKPKKTKEKKRTTSDKQEKVKEKSGVKEARADNVGECERRAWVVKTKEANADAKKDERGKELVVSYRPKISAMRKSDWIERNMVNAVDESDRTGTIDGKMLNVVKKSNRTVEIQSKMVNAPAESERTVKIEGKMLNVVKKSNGTVEVQNKKVNAIEENDGKVKIEGKILNAVKKSSRTMKIRSKVVNAAEESDRRVNIGGKMVNAVEEIDGKMDESDRTSHIEGKMVNTGEDNDGRMEDNDGRMETQSRTVNAVEGSNRTLHIEGKMVSTGKKSDVNVETERRFGVKEEDGGAKKQARVIRPSDGFNRSYGRSGGGGLRGDYRAEVHRGGRRGIKHGMVWVRKQEVATSCPVELLK